MVVKVSKVMTNFINKNVLNGTEFKANYHEITTDIYGVLVHYDVISHGNDFNEKNGKMKVIEITYPDEYYAMPKYLTTNDLVRVFRESDKTVESFCKCLWKEIEI